MKLSATQAKEITAEAQARIELEKKVERSKTRRSIAVLLKGVRERALEAAFEGRKLTGTVNRLKM